MENANKGMIVSLASLVAARGEARRLGLGSGGRILSTRMGSHLSPFRGPGAEHDESRIYVPGDDPRHMDWRVTARTARAHVKVYRDERERPLWLIVDQGLSMRFGTRVAFKSVIAARACALLGWAGVEHGDRVGGLVFDEQSRNEQIPATRQRGLLPLLRALTPIQRRGRQPGCTSIAEAAMLLHRQIRPGSLVFIISDFNATTMENTAWLTRLCSHSEVVLVSVHDPIEEHAPPPGRYPVIQDQGGHYLLDSRDASRRARYESCFQNRLALLEHLAYRYAAHLLILRTDWPVGSALARGLGQRTGKTRQ
ncbi:MAG TPA: DUF58 domain-containing protein [Chromatiaceae bacterium]|jgi:uncharacterized protein (DUF58 family)|nr:MAG: hypothetical protein N838_00550 [Thiohalocapsa sp. PB-PSB1]QQO56552.1 MAG: DUF58 domain-containing protein [Thiohalocapsa sp. PB-PSB1]HBG96563.1 DUF58 domain-containing protein [Chromatiaceae bacterium]HCS91309.1 DUF58 domain-containing protein [Chromatiaceae bacterium]